MKLISYHAVQDYFHAYIDLSVFNMTHSTHICQNAYNIIRYNMLQYNMILYEVKTKTGHRPDFELTVKNTSYLTQTVDLWAFNWAHF